MQMFASDKFDKKQLHASLSIATADHMHPSLLCDWIPADLLACKYISI